MFERIMLGRVARPPSPARRRIVAACFAAGLLLASAASTLATQPTGHKVTICHATDSETNPYVVDTVDIASAGYPDYETGHASHTGPIWDPTLKEQHVKWGDIIPSYTYQPAEGNLFSYAGLNWTTQGQAVWDDECVVPGQSAGPTAAPSESAPPSGSTQPSQSASAPPTGSAEATGSTPPTGSAAATGGGAAVTPPATSTGPLGGSSGAALALALVLLGLSTAGVLMFASRPRSGRRR